MIRRYAKILLAAMFVANFMFAQSEKVFVYSSNGKPIADAVVMSEKHSAVTDKSGGFEIALFLNDSVLTIKHLAYETKTVRIGELIKSGRIVLRSKIFETEEVRVNEISLLDETSVNIDVGARLRTGSIAVPIKTKFPLFVKDYGGDAGLKTVSFRGLSSENTLVLFNEARVNDLRSGAFDFASVGVNSVDEIIFSENGTGGYISSGGVLNIVSGNIPNGNNLSLSYGFSNIGKQSFSGRGELDFGKLSANFNFERSFSPNEFPFKFEGETMRRANADFSRDFYGGSVIYNNEKIYAKLYAHYSKFENGLPGFVVSNNANSSFARSENYGKLFTANFTVEIFKNVTYKANANYLAQTVAISDTSGELLINREYERAEMQGAGLSNVLLFSSNNFQAALGTELSAENLNSLSPAFLEESRYSSKRFSAKYFISPEFTAGDINYLGKLVLGGTFAYLRNEELIIERKTEEGYGSLNGYLKIIPDENLSFKISYSKNYRMPTFTELYYSYVFSSEKIRGESYRNFSFASLYKNGGFAAKLSLYKIFGENKIVWMPTRLALQVPRNIKAVNSQGAEFTVKFSGFPEGADFSLIYVYNLAKNVSAQSADDASYGKDLIYSPRHQIKAAAEYKYGNWFASLNYTFVSKRFFTSDNNPRYVLPSYNVFDFSAGFFIEAFSVRHRFSFNVFNITNESYFVIQSYPMPLRTFSFVYSLEIL